MASESEQELDDRWWLGLRGKAVESVDTHEFNVKVSFGSRSTLTIESVAYLQLSPRQPETPLVTLNQDGTVSTSATVLTLTGRRVVSSVGFKTGALRLVFDTGAQLRIPFGKQYEAWQLTGPSGRMWVSLPGGGLATFPGEPD